MTKFRTVLLAAVATAALGGTAGAETVAPITTNGLWETASAAAPDGTQTACFIRTHNADGWYLIFGARAGTDKFSVTLASDNFAAKTAKTALRLQIDDYSAWTAGEQNITVEDHKFSFRIAPANAKQFVHEITAGTTAHITFDNGNAWNVSLAGTTPAWEAMMPCLKATAPNAVASLTGQIAPPVTVAATAPPAASSDVIGVAPIVWQNGSYTIQVALNGRTFTFELDTGASAVVVPQQVAYQLMRDGTLTVQDYKGPVKTMLADGSTNTNDVYILRSVTVGGRTINNVPCFVGGTGSSLLLGQTFLRRFKSWSTDNEGGVLILGEPIA